MYYTVRNTVCRGYHREDPDVDTITVSESGPPNSPPGARPPPAPEHS